MKKEAYYFSHDYNARSDEKIIKLIRATGWEGYGLFWAIVEKLYEARGAIISDYDCIAFDLRSQCDRIKSVCEDFDLFYRKDGRLRSISVDRRLLERLERSESSRKSANIRWGKCERNATTSLPHCQKGKERKEKEKKGTDITTGEPKSDTNIQKVVNAYKIVKGIDKNDKGWDKANFGRYSKAAKSLLGLFVGMESAVAYVIAQGNEFTDKGLSWTLETVARHAWDNKGKFFGGENERERNSMDANCVVGSGGLRGVAHAGDIAKKVIGDILPARPRLDNEDDAEK